MNSETQAAADNFASWVASITMPTLITTSIVVILLRVAFAFFEVRLPRPLATALNLCVALGAVFLLVFVVIPWTTT